MNTRPKIITLEQIAEVIAETFKTQAEITCYVGSNAATPTASLTVSSLSLNTALPICGT